VIFLYANNVLADYEPCLKKWKALEVQAELYASYSEKCLADLKEYNKDKNGMCENLIESRIHLKNTMNEHECSHQERYEYYLNNKDKALKYIYDITDGEKGIKFYNQFYKIE